MYGISKVGVPEIDIDLTNIDTYLSLVEPHGFTPESFRQLIDALISHFAKEEASCARLQLNFTKEHRAEHQRLTKVLWTLKLDGKRTEEHLMFFRQTLMFHILEFDMTINANKAG